MEQFKISKILTAFGIFMLGYQSMQLNTNDFRWAVNSIPYIGILAAISAIVLGNFLAQKNK